jgi:putative ABC transport system substrate-binding protein
MTTIEIRSTGFTKGTALLRDPLLNKGTALRPKNANAMGCAGLLPAHAAHAIYFTKKELSVGAGLIGYGMDHFEENRRATIYVRKILQGAEPDDLPIEQAAKFQFIVNLDTARALGIIIPPSIIVRADVIE